MSDEKKEESLMEQMTRIYREFTDHRPAVLVKVCVHPDYYDVFLADLREAGVEKVKEPAPFIGVEVYRDESVPYGVRRCHYAGGGYEDV